MYFWASSQIPESEALEVAVDYVRSDNEINTKAGAYRSHTYFKSQLPNERYSTSQLTIKYEGAKMILEVEVYLSRSNDE